ncbi:hypothetical protein VTO58DRAFT_110357 [Aureobasidium pullulans]
MPKHVVFDVVGTCVSYSAFFTSIQKVLGPRLLAHNITPKLFGFAWMESSEREFTYLSISSRYKPYKKVFSTMFYHAERDEMVKSYSDLELREGVKEAFTALREAGFTPLYESFGEEEKWFAAAHYWDVSAAKIVGFKGAYCSVYEKEDCKELFDVDMDVMADTLPEMAQKIIEASK